MEVGGGVIGWWWAILTDLKINKKLIIGEIEIYNLGANVPKKNWVLIVEKVAQIVFQVDIKKIKNKKKKSISRIQ